MKEIEGAWLTQLLRCAERLYIIDEESREVLWISDGIRRGEESGPLGKPCWQTFFGRETRCPFCPKLSVDGDVYTWDFYDGISGHWMKVNNVLFSHEGRLLRAGNMVAIDDAMELNHEAISEISLLQQLLKENQRIKEALENESTHDAMTGLFNRNRFMLDMRGGALGGPLGAIYLDLNNLKETNDLFRHSAGDALICRLAEAIRRTAQSAPDARCYRLGGDEFVMLLPGCGEPELAARKAEFEAHLEALNRGEHPACIAAVGTAHADTAEDIERLVSRADAEMYRDKQKKKGIA